MIASRPTALLLVLAACGTSHRGDFPSPRETTMPAPTSEPTPIATATPPRIATLQTATFALG